jgi:methyl-accepting chemotaxis protein
MNWENMSVARKMAVGFGGCIILISIVAIFNYFSLSKIKALFQETKAGTSNYAFFLEKEIDHLKWAASISELFLNAEVNELSVETDDHKCGLGKWLYGEGAQAIAARSKENSELIAALKNPHERLHQSAIAINESYNAFDPSIGKLVANRWIDHLNWIKNLSNSLITGIPFQGGL